jgi:hypothetical protein
MANKKTTTKQTTPLAIAFTDGYHIIRDFDKRESLVMGPLELSQFVKGCRQRDPELIAQASKQHVQAMERRALEDMARLRAAVVSLGIVLDHSRAQR